jgi:hypothetical protein
MKQSSIKDLNVDDEFDVTGVYVLHSAFLKVLKGKLKIVLNEDQFEGFLSWYFFRKKLVFVKRYHSQWIFSTTMDFVVIEVILTFQSLNTFRGIIDTPVGHLLFNGFKISGYTR